MKETLLTKSTLSIKEISLIVIGAIFLFLATPPCDIFFLSYLSLFIGMLSLKERNKAFLKGFLFGFIYNLLSMYWIAYVLMQYGNLPLIVSLMLLILLVCYLSLYTAVFFKIYTLFDNKLPIYLQPVVAGIVWSFLEIIRAKLMTGFPWMLIAYTQHSFLPMMQNSKYITVYGIGFFIVFTNVSLLKLFTEKSPKRYISISVSVLLMLFLIYIGNKGIVQLKNEYSDAKKINIRGVQGNIDQSKKWDKNLQKEIINKYLLLTGETRSDIVIWPETALPFVYGVDSEWTEYFKSLLSSKNYALITGFVGIGYDEDGKTGFTNSAGIFYNGNLQERYDKIHLVPFGEYVPLKKLLFFVNKLVEAAGDFLKGKDTNLLSYNGIKIGVLICYEAIFPEISKNYKEKGANILVNITNDAWFGNTPAPHQHLAMARFRAVENGVYLIRIANTGISCVITPWGEILSKTHLFKDAVINEVVYYK